MAIIFENIDNDQTVSIDRETGGKFYGAKLSAAINSSNLGINHDRGQDGGWRLQAEQQVIMEEWESDPQMIEKVSQWSKVPVDMLQHGEFLSYLLYEQEAGKSPERVDMQVRKDKHAAYEARVAEIKAQKNAEPVPAFVAPDTKKK